MKKTLVKHLLSFAIMALILVPVLGVAHNAHALDTGINEVTTTIDLGNKDPRETIGEIINVVMLFLAIIAVVIVLLGGFKWMTAGGNEDKVAEARKLLGAGIIGLVIILAAWGIASFILTRLINATA